MSKNGYDISQCQHKIDKLQQCCKKHQVRPCLSHWLALVRLEVYAVLQVMLCCLCGSSLFAVPCIPCN